MFPQNGKNVPEIRFEGFTEDWEQRKLGDLVDRVTRKNQDLVSELPLTISAQHGLIDQNEFFDKRVASKDVSGYYLIEKGEFAYNKSTSTDAPWGAIKRLDRYENGVLSTLYIIFGIKENDPVDSDFLVSYYSTNLWHKGIHEIAAEGARNHGLLNIAPADFFETKLMIPQDIGEQKKIGSYFMSLDHLITLHQRKYKTLRKTIRYAWEQRKFGDITELKSASRVHKGEWTDSGVPFFRSSDVMAAINGTTNEKAYISEELYQKLSSASGKLEEGDVLITGGGSVGNPYIVPNNEPLYTKDADLLWIKNQGRFHPYFLYEYFFSPTFRTHLSSISHVGTIAHYTITQLSETPICLPDIEEQTKVGEYFESLDHLITLHQRKYKTLRKTIRYAWEQRKFGELYKKVNEKNDLSFGTDKIISVANMYFKEDVKESSDDYMRTYNVMRLGDIAFEGNKSKNFSHGRFVENTIGDGIVSHVFDVFRPIMEYDILFWKYLINNENVMGRIMTRCTKASTMMTNLVAKDFLNEKVLVPTIKEQSRIGEFINQIDHLITLHQRKYEELQKIKKFMLQNMFV